MKFIVNRAIAALAAVAYLLMHAPAQASQVEACDIHANSENQKILGGVQYLMYQRLHQSLNAIQKDEFNKARTAFNSFLRFQNAYTEAVNTTLDTEAPNISNAMIDCLTDNDKQNKYPKDILIDYASRNGW
ncbi:MAG: hypothetical protein CLLPBCKN_002095 [Chroococcidiopsis cubana SAG 39.79]|uniref:Uncharacterized protein n=2 Tax=Chroococcidiopsis TaxID=54298 RepID=K9U8K5_CHRTP|nr:MULTISPECIES: hypothetical protein [Chroococcidiopsis]AFY90958.1 hypothetical protein Chro_5603 [Chroococcidiopsis thermalis PCC 7203]MDZ4872699.1 hypothetical protein [Chroococcidiopsis cubana SAG 39.79]PSB62992.1 hypothetical protein C7B79_15740 [Chroococcidiopsis cubana CCALA 043]RUT06319.1 hypothetical protein DSM107010_53230 [Chroococcidiopsis cubana SAG 39.79]